MAAPLPAATGSRLPSLTSARFFAALAVVIHHSGMFWTHLPVLVVLSQTGWLGVTFFFALSGFVIGWGWRPAQPAWPFWFRRMARIYPLHVLCLGASLLGFWLLHEPLAGYKSPLGDVWANLFLLQSWDFGRLDIRQSWNGVSWTLSCEAFFYGITPLLFPLLLRLHPRCAVLLAAGIWAAICLAVHGGTRLHCGGVTDFLIFAPPSQLFIYGCGAYAAFHLRRGGAFPPRLAGAAMAVLPVAAYCLLTPLALRNEVYMWALFLPGTICLTAAMAQRELTHPPGWMAAPIWLKLGEASFALYMTHALLLGLALHYHLARPGIPAWRLHATGLGLVTLVILVSVLVHLLFEHPLRQYLLGLIEPKHRPGKGVSYPERA